MKKDIHPSNYREVVFKDMSNEEIFITRSTIATKETIEVDGVTYPLVKLEITSASHPFFTGKQIKYKSGRVTIRCGLIRYEEILSDGYYGAASRLSSLMMMKITTASTNITRLTANWL